MSFEVARRHRFTRDMATIPDGVEAHVLPAAGTSSRDDSLLAHRDFSGVQARIDATYAASRDFLDAELGRLSARSCGSSVGWWWPRRWSP